MENNVPTKVETNEENVGILTKIIMILKKIKHIFKTGSKVLVFSILMRTLSIFCKLKENKILFLSDVRNVLDGNLAFIYNELDDTKCEKILSFKSDRKEKRKFKEKFKLLYNIVTAKYIILDDYSRFISIMKPRKGQEICQLWHALGAFKKFGFSRQDKDKVKKMNSHRNYTKAVVSSDSIRWCYAEGFGINIENVKATGMARTDIFFDKNYIKQSKEKIYKKYPFLKNKKVILFAPTYRGTSLKAAYYDFDKLDVDKIYNELKDKNYVFIFKWHPGLYYKMKKEEINPYDFSKYPEFYYDLSEERDVNDLLLVTDMLITDYSSVIFDYALLNKPVTYFVYDYEEYSKDRGLYFDFDEYVYGSVAKNSNELIEAIKENKVLKDKREKFMSKFMDACDGNATRKTAEWIFEDNLDFLINRK